MHRISEKKELDDKFISRLHESIKELRHYCKNMMAFCGHPNYVKYVYELFIQAVIVYQVSMINAEAYWYQMKFDQVYVLGKPATATIPAVYSFREKLHKHTVDALRTMANGWSHSDRHNGEQPKGTANVNMILRNDLYYYPIPLIIGDHPQPSVANNSGDLLADKYSTPVITLPNHKYPYIYRVDASCMRPEPTNEDFHGCRQVYPKEPVSGCIGVLYHSIPSLKIKLTRSRKVRVRIFGTVHNEVSQIIFKYSIGTDDGGANLSQVNLTPVQDAVGTLPVFTRKEDDMNDDYSNVKWSSGFTQTEKFDVESDLTFTLCPQGEFDDVEEQYPPEDKTPSYVRQGYSRALFIEFIVSDI
ncbi:hypothetical protein SAMD00019534_003010, partial [Acytostelium subglobosum LB1]|uniref:hypothetical protein n=1 Tax=Acytostelium subglobosum LB1 TaxID=1410327 RepID=UPI0006449176